MSCWWAPDTDSTRSDVEPEVQGWSWVWSPTHTILNKTLKTLCCLDFLDFWLGSDQIRGSRFICSVEFLFCSPGYLGEIPGGLAEKPAQVRPSILRHNRQNRKRDFLWEVFDGVVHLHHHGLGVCHIGKGWQIKNLPSWWDGYIWKLRLDKLKESDNRKDKARC